MRGKVGFQGEYVMERHKIGIGRWLLPVLAVAEVAPVTPLPLNTFLFF